MLNTVLELLGIDINIFNIDDNVLFVCLFSILIFSMGYVFDFFKTLIERCTAKR